MPTIEIAAVVEISIPHFGLIFVLSILTMSDKKVVSFGDVHSCEPTNASFSPDGRCVAYTSTDGCSGSSRPSHSRWCSAGSKS